MNILHISPYYAPAYAFGGVVRAVEGLAMAQAAQGHTVTVLTTDALTPTLRLSGPGEDVREGVRVVRVRNTLYMLRRWNLSSPLGLAAALKPLAPDVIHLHEFRTLENLLALPTLKRIPTVLSPHGTLRTDTGRSTLKTAWDRLLSPHLARVVRHIIALTTPEHTEIEAVWRTFAPVTPPITVIPNGIDASAYARLPDPAPLRERYGIAPAERVILFLGRLHERKGVLALVQAFVQARLPHTWLMLAGPDEGMQAQLSAQANEHVIFTGYVDGNTRLQALALADVFVLPAVGEGLSMAVLEALAAGLPVLLSPGCNMPQTEARGAGRIVLPTVDALATALTQMMTDDTSRQQMGQAAQAWARAAFAWESIVEEMDAVYAGVL